MTVFAFAVTSPAAGLGCAGLKAFHPLLPTLTKLYLVHMRTLSEVTINHEACCAMAPAALDRDTATLGIRTVVGIFAPAPVKR